MQQSTDAKLAIVWTSGDRDVALNMVFMYAQNSKRMGWWSEVEVVVWGPSARLLAEDMDIQAAMVSMQAVGVVVTACIACASNYGVVDDLIALGVDVKGMGVPLTEYLKSGVKVLTF